VFSLLIIDLPRIWYKELQMLGGPPHDSIAVFCKFFGGELGSGLDFDEALVVWIMVTQETKFEGFMSLTWGVTSMLRDELYYDSEIPSIGLV
jgi:hypothetical protein